MPLSSAIRLFDVKVKQKGHEGVFHLRDVRSIMEVSDEENETIRAISFHNEGTWRDVNLDEVEEIIIKPLHRRSS